MGSKRARIPAAERARTNETDVTLRARPGTTLSWEMTPMTQALGYTAALVLQLDRRYQPTVVRVPSL